MLHPHKYKIVPRQCATCRYEHYKTYEWPCQVCYGAKKWKAPARSEKLNAPVKEDCNCD